MKNIWILSKKDLSEYENSRLIQECTNLDVQPKLVHPDNFDIIVTKDDRKSVIYKGESIKLPDLLINRTGSDTDYFSLAIIRQFERLGVRTINNSYAIERVKDKLYTAQVLAQYSLPTPKTMLVRFPVDSNHVAKQIGFPCVVKVVTGSFGQGVYLSKDADSFKDLMELVKSLRGTTSIILQEFIDQKAGTDIRVWVIGDRVVGAMLRSSTDGSFKANISRGGRGEPFEVDDNLKFLALKTAEALDLDIAGIDFLFDKDGYKICEANSAPGFEGFEFYCNQNIAKEVIDFCNKISYDSF
jgi:gamma-F420-2:alpha-L-glutamate ligase